jgi:hypothetical protein
MDNTAAIARDGGRILQTNIVRAISVLTGPVKASGGGINPTAGAPMGPLPRITAPPVREIAMTPGDSASFNVWKRSASGITSALPAIHKL